MTPANTTKDTQHTKLTFYSLNKRCIGALVNSEGGRGGHRSSGALKQHYVTLTDPLLQKTKLNNAPQYSAQNSNFSKIRSYFTEKMPAGFPSDVRWLLCLSAAFYFSNTVTSSSPVLQLQLWSAGSLHVAFWNLRESQSWGRAVVGHHLHKIRHSLTHIVLCHIWICIVKFRFSKPWVSVKVT